MKFLTRLGTAAVAGMAVFSLNAGVASADSSITYDGVHGDYRGDLIYTRVTHSSTRVKILADVNKVSGGDVYTAWIDTRSSDAGPEYKLEMMPNSDYLSLWAVESFTSRGRLVCGTSFSGHADIFSPVSEIWWSVPRRCLGYPNRVRVAMRAKFMNQRTYAYTYDWLVAKQRFTGWVYR